MSVATDEFTAFVQTSPADLNIDKLSVIVKLITPCTHGLNERKQKTARLSQLKYIQSVLTYRYMFGPNKSHSPYNETN